MYFTIVYLSVDATAALDPVRLFAFMGNSRVDYRWNIKIEMIDCSQINSKRGKGK